MVKSINAVLFRTLFIIAVFSSCAAAQLTNGDFSSGLSGWAVESGTVTDGGGYAFFEPGEFGDPAILSQEFTMPDGAQTLTFDVDMVSEDEGGPGPETDIFTAYLYKSSADLTPLFSISSNGEFFYMDNEDFIGIDSRMVSLDVSGFGSMNAFLVFKLTSDIEDGVLATVSLDNVNISAIPVPGALLLAFVGTGLVGCLRRRGIAK
jgi:hypothetical protein